MKDKMIFASAVAVLVTAVFMRAIRWWPINDRSSEQTEIGPSPTGPKTRSIEAGSGQIIQVLVRYGGSSNSTRFLVKTLREGSPRHLELQTNSNAMILDPDEPARLQEGIDRLRKKHSKLKLFIPPAGPDLEPPKNVATEIKPLAA
jgi:hypothetical protein